MSKRLRYFLTSKKHFDAATVRRILEPLQVPAAKVQGWRYRFDSFSASAGQILQGTASSYLSGLKEEERRGRDRAKLLLTIQKHAESLRASILNLYEADDGILFDLRYAGTSGSSIPDARKHLLRELEAMIGAAKSGGRMARSFATPAARKRGEHGKAYVECAVFLLCDLAFDLTGEPLTATRGRRAPKPNSYDERSCDALSMSGTPGAQYLERFFREFKTLFPKEFATGGVTATTLEKTVRRWSKCRRSSAHRRSSAASETPILVSA
jgi:hypothetical protein